MIAELPDERWPAVRTSWPGILLGGAIIDGHRGRLEEAELIVARCSVMQSSADLQERSAYLVARANLLLMSGDPAQALECAESAFEARNVLGITQEYLKQAFVAAVEAALEVGDLAKVEELLTDVDSLAPGHSSQFLQAHLLRFRARHAGWVGNHEGADEGFKSAADLFRELEFRFYLAVTMLERAESLRIAGEEQEAESLTAEARPIFEDLDAKPWLERLSQAEPAHGAEAVAHGS
jgi:tetratricopeptide (TPR) repeat protein